MKFKYTREITVLTAYELTQSNSQVVIPESSSQEGLKSSAFMNSTLWDAAYQKWTADKTQLISTYELLVVNHIADFLQKHFWALALQALADMKYVLPVL